VGGLCAAKALSACFEKVTVIDRDEFELSKPQPRTGVPQGQQLHALLARGCTVADALFPGIVSEWIQHGATKVDLIKHTRMQMKGVALPKSERQKDGPTLNGIGMTRPFMEFHLRRRLISDCPNVQLRTRTRATGLIYDAKTSTVTGVRIKKRKDKSQEKSADDEDVTELLADAVVCSTGRRSQMEKWLTSIGVLGEGKPVPQETSFPGLGYMTGIWRPPEGWIEKNTEFESAFFAFPYVGGFSTGFGCIALEDGDYGIFIFSYGKNYPPNTTSEILERLEPTIAADNELVGKILREWTQVRDWVSYHDQRNVLHHYEKMSKWPEHLYAIGDSVATFNPSYAQGMTQAIVHVDILLNSFQQHMREYPVHDFSGLSTKFQKEASLISNNFWTAVQANDLEWPATEGERTRFKSFMAYFQTHVLKLAMTSRDKTFRFLQVTNGLVPPEQVFFSPEFFFPVLVAMGKELWQKYKAGTAKV